MGGGDKGTEGKEWERQRQTDTKKETERGGEGERKRENHVKWCSVHISGLSLSTSMGKFSMKFI